MICQPFLYDIIMIFCCQFSLQSSAHEGELQKVIKAQITLLYVSLMRMDDSGPSCLLQIEIQIRKGLCMIVIQKKKSLQASDVRLEIRCGITKSLGFIQRVRRKSHAALSEVPFKGRRCVLTELSVTGRLISALY